MDLFADPDIDRILNTDKQIGKYRIKVSEILARHKQQQHPSRKSRKQELIHLCQLVEASRFTSRPPKWFPQPLVGRYDAYLVWRNGRGLIGLSHHGGLEYNAVGWIEQATLETDLIEANQRPGPGQMSVEITHHCLQQYLDRWASASLSATTAAASLYRLIGDGMLLPDFPAWFDDHDYSNQSPSYIILLAGEQAMIPVTVAARDRPQRLVAKTFLFRDMHLYPGNRLPDNQRH